MDRLHAMEAFIRIVESGSFSAAARDLRLGQPAISKLIAGLEARLGVRLLVRSTRQLSPTEAGQVFYERAIRVLGDAEAAETAARGLGLGLEGRLRVCAPVTFARLHLAPHLGSFLDAHPKLSFELIMDDRTIDLLEENIDVALRMGELADSSLTARKIGQAERLVVGSVDYFARCGRPLQPADLLGHSAIIYAQAAGGDEWRFRKGSTENAVQMRSRLSCSAAEGVRAAVIAGLGLAIVSRWMMAPELAAGNVVPVLTDWTLPMINLWAVYPAGRMSRGGARAFVDWFQSLRL